MRRRASCWRVAAGLLIASALSGCFASREPLITAANADTPIAGGSTITEYFNCDTAAGKLVGCSGYQSRGGAKLTVKDGAYILHPDPNPALAALFPGGQAKDMTFRLKQVGGGAYVLQLAMDDPAAAADAPRYVYEVMQLKGQTAYFWIFDCEKNGDAAYVRSGALARITDALLVPTCEPASLDGLAKVFNDRIAGGAKPDEKYEIAPPS